MLKANIDYGPSIKRRILHLAFRSYIIIIIKGYYVPHCCVLIVAFLAELLNSI